ncbi:MAG: FAD-dependent oxidoreductase [Oscillospiraceae bacterium]|nr:FAD-dependent oxidoreductase [Oscillospiraceae bacterium]
MASIWQYKVPVSEPPPLGGVCDAAIIGGGMTGVLCALRLAEMGVRDVAVLEQGLIGGGTTPLTTGKLTAQHRLIYSDLSESRGPSIAAAYARSHTEAISDYAALCGAYGISCEYESKDSVVYTRDPKKLPALRLESEAARAAGLAVCFEPQAPLPLNTAGALRTFNQAQFHPVKFLEGAVRAASGLGVRFYEHTRVTDIRRGLITTGKGKLRAQKIIIATRYPLLDKWGMYFLRLYQSRSYVVALANTGADTPPVMAVDENKDGLSFRSARHDKHGPLTLLGGFAHKTGTQGGQPHFAKLCEAARKLYPNARLVARWSAQDCITHDRVPYIGPHSSPRHDGLYVAAGFNKWGMTSAMVAANILSNVIVKGFSPYLEVYSPKRAGSGIKPGSFIKHAGLITSGLTQGLYRPHDERGVCPRCTHMRSALHWNSDEETWDCPAHGSRFDESGCIIETPAQDFLRKEQEGP